MDECDALCARAYAAAMKLAQEKGAKAVGFSLLCAGIFRGEQSLQSETYDPGGRGMDVLMCCAVLCCAVR